MPPTKLEVNAAIDRLLSDKDPHDLSDALPVIEFMKDVELSELSSGTPQAQVGFYKMYLHRLNDGTINITLTHLQNLQSALLENRRPPASYYIACSRVFTPEYFAMNEDGKSLRKFIIKLKFWRWFYWVQYEKVASIEVILRGPNAGIKREVGNHATKTVKSCLPWPF